MMGFLMERHCAVLISGTPEGACPECACEHEPELPHNLQSLAYQYRFYDEHGRWPTWDDAMAHCTDEVKALWTEMLSAVLAKGVQ